MLLFFNCSNFFQLRRLKNIFRKWKTFTRGNEMHSKRSKKAQLNKFQRNNFIKSNGTAQPASKSKTKHSRLNSGSRLKNRQIGKKLSDSKPSKSKNYTGKRRSLTNQVNEIDKKNLRDRKESNKLEGLASEQQESGSGKLNVSNVSRKYYELKIDENKRQKNKILAMIRSNRNKIKEMKSIRKKRQIFSQH